MKEFNSGDILLAEDLNTMSNAIEDISLSLKSVNDVLLETIQDVEYLLECQTADLANFTYKTLYSASVFSGWASYLGVPEQIDRLKSVFTVRANYPIGSVRIVFWEMPEASAMEFSQDKRTYTPKMGSWNVLYTYNKSFAEPYTSAGVRNLVIDFEEPIINTNHKHLCVGIMFDNLVTMGFLEKTVTDAPFNPCIYYTTNGNYALSLISGGGNYREYDDPVFWCVPVEIYRKNVSREYLGINTGRGGRFNKAVIDSINNSDTFSTVFSEKNVPAYLYGSQNLFTNNTYTKTSLTSTFTGRLHAIGKLSSEMVIKGVRLKVCPRVWQSAGGHCTKVYAYLYTIERLPLSSESLTFSALNPVLVASGEAECDIEAEQVLNVDIYFTETFSNEDNKYLALGFHLDTYCHMLFSSATASTEIGRLDGSTYTKVDAYYATATGSSMSNASWSRVWADDKLFCYSLFTAEKQFDFGEGFYDFVNEAIQEYIDEGGGDDEGEDTPVAPTSEVRLAKLYDVVVGDTFQLFYTGVVKSFNPIDLGIRVICSVGDQYPRYYQFTPTAENAGHEYTLTLTTRLLDGREISKGTTKIVVHPKLTNATTPANLNILCFGDSLTSSGTWCSEGLRRIYGTATSGYSGPASIGVTNTVTSYGTKTNTNNTFLIKHEGYGGWTWGSFLATTASTSTTSQMTAVLPSPHGLDLVTIQKSIWVDNNNLQWELEDFPNESSLKFNRGPGNDLQQSQITLPTSISCSTLGLSYNAFTANWGSANPFYDDISGTISFTAHAQRFNNPGADIVACLLTWNGASITATFNNQSGITTHMNNATTLLKKIHTDFPNAKIIVMGILISSLTGGCGANYHATGSYSDYWSTAFYAFDYNKALEELVTEDLELSDYCYYVDTKGQFDTEYNMPYSNVAVNTRKTGVTEMRGTNGVHPSTDGYYQIGDAFYRKLTAVIPTLVNNE